jgi:UDP-N-acetylmuramate--alanine ligase
MPRDIGPIHFVGIGGIGMSGIAEVLANQNYRVQGSDIAESANVQRLRDKGIAVAIGHAPDNLGEAAVVVVSSAIERDNAELKAARARGLPVVRRAEMLAELMRLKSSIAVGGTHGKTTTTSMVAALLDAGGLDPTVINGGIINAYGTNARMGEGDWMVVTAPSSSCRPISPWSPMSILSIWIILARLTICARRSSTSWKMCRSTDLPSCASITRKCRRWWRASRTGG